VPPVESLIVIVAAAAVFPLVIRIPVRLFLHVGSAGTIVVSVVAVPTLVDIQNEFVGNVILFPVVGLALALDSTGQVRTLIAAVIAYKLPVVLVDSPARIHVFEPVRVSRLPLCPPKG
jgi:hypothetical protein